VDTVKTVNHRPTMSILDSLNRVWKTQLLLHDDVVPFPALPHFDSFDINGAITQGSLCDGLARCRRTINELEGELKKKRFIERFIVDILCKRLSLDGLDITEEVDITFAESTSVDYSGSSGVGANALQQDVEVCFSR